jgi:hypothetical protein
VSQTAVAWTTIAVPNEHGGWGMLAEPLLVGLAVAPSPAGGCLLLASLAAFLARHPLKLAISDRRRGARYPRTAAAERFALGYSAVAAGAAAGAYALGGLPPFIPLLAVAPLAAVQAFFDARLQGRHLAAELCGGVALAALAPAVMVAGGWPWIPSLAAGALLAMKAATAVLYVRTRLRLVRGLAPRVWPAHAAHAAALAAATALAVAAAAPWTAVAATALLLARSVHGLSAARPAVRPQVIGFQELGLGVAFAAALAVGYVFSR